MFSCTEQGSTTSSIHTADIPTVNIANCSISKEINHFAELDSIYTEEGDAFIDKLVANPNYDLYDQLYYSWLSLGDDINNSKKYSICKSLCDTLVDSNSESHRLLLAKAMHSIGKYNYNNKEYKKAYKSYRISRNLHQINESEICYGELDCLMQLGYIKQYYLSDIDSALYYWKIQETYINNNEKLTKFQYSNYYSQASIYRRRKDYGTATNYANLCLEAVKSTNEIDTNHLISAHALLGNIYYKTNKSDAAIKNYKDAISYGEMINIADWKLVHYYQSIVSVYNKAKQYDKAEYYINKSISLSKDDNVALGKAIGLKASIFFKNNELSNASKTFKKAIDILEPVKDEVAHTYYEYCYLLSLVEREMGNINKAIDFGTKALEDFFIDGDLQLSKMYNEPNSVRFLNNLAEYNAEKAMRTNDERYVNIAIKLYKTLDNLVQYYSGYTDADAVLLNQASFNEYYYNYFKFKYWLNERKPDNEFTEFAIGMISKYKAQSLQRNSYLTPDENIILKRLNESYKKNLRHIEELKFKLEASPSNNISDYNLEKKYIETSKYLYDSIRILHKDYTIKNKELLKLIESYALQNNYIIVDYFIPTDKEGDIGYVFITDGKSSSIEKINNISQIVQNANDYHMHLSSNNTIDIKKYASILYEQLLVSWSSYDLRNKSGLLIIPDHNLRKIPFESLKANSEKYLIEDIPILYGFCLKNLVLKNESKYKSKDNRVLAFGHSDKSSIFSDKTMELPELPGSYKETRAIKTVYGSNCKLYSGTNATKKRFLDLAIDYPIIHLAMHGKADTSYRHKSCIYFRFSGGITPLYPHELIDQNIKPELLFLSSCESAKGKMYAQEGMFSIARGFYISGCEKVVSSLWDIDDETGAKIVKNFYTIKKQHADMPYEIILQKAKMKYLKESISSQVSPTYWSSLVLYQ